MSTNLFPHGRWLLCSPQFFDVTYEINPWMSVKNSPVRAESHEQWRVLKNTLIRLGADVHCLPPALNNPDLVYTANAGLVKGTDFVLSRFRYPERRGEEPIFQSWFEEKGFRIIRVESGFFEGEGDALFVGETLFGGFGFRSESQVYKEIAQKLELKRVVPVELTDSRFYHLDICFCPLNDTQALFHPSGIHPSSIKEMEKHVELIPVPKEDGDRFVCNAVVLGDAIVLPSGCSKTYEVLAKHGVEPYPVEMSEFIKGGGASKCLSLRVDRG